MRRQDHFWQGVRGWLRLHEKGGKRHDVPAHHRAEEAVEAYVVADELEDGRAPLFQSVDRAGRLSGRPLGRRAPGGGLESSDAKAAAVQSIDRGGRDRWQLYAPDGGCSSTRSSAS
ncbi:MAG: hypothetical protein OXH75_16535 [Acidobacteria bacterium]|nr:hypothetical protein [Acidobacteriota bacterium]